MVEGSGSKNQSHSGPWTLSPGPLRTHPLVSPYDALHFMRESVRTVLS